MTKEFDMHDDEQRREWVSALVDGQLEQAAFMRAVEGEAGIRDALVTWHAYHVVGDVLRAPDLANCAGDRAFLDRFRARLAQAGTEPECLETHATHAVPVPLPRGTVQTVASGRSEPAANDAVLRWKWLASVASLVAVAVLGWHLGVVNTTQWAGIAGERAQAQVQLPATGSEPPVMLRDARLDQLLAAHRQFGGTSALQMPAGFLRNATFEAPERK